MDVLSDIIRLIRPRTVLLGGMAGYGRWGVRMPPQPGPVFYFVTEGHCWFQPRTGVALTLETGDYVLSTQPDGDAFLSEPDISTDLSDDAFKTSHSVDGEIRVGDGEGPPTRVMGGLILCEPANATLLDKLLPRLVHVRAADDRNARLGALVNIINDEVRETHPGRDAMLARLVEVLLIETLRRRDGTDLPASGVLRALAHPQLTRALTQIHADVGRSWTIAELARHAGMSRSVFARRFSEEVGAAPVEYLLSWRMALAKDALIHGPGTLEEVAAAVGYKSASAFSTTFSQKVGCPPSDYPARLDADPGFTKPRQVQ